MNIPGPSPAEEAAEKERALRMARSDAQAWLTIEIQGVHVKAWLSFDDEKLKAPLWTERWITMADGAAKAGGFPLRRVEGSAGIGEQGPRYYRTIAEEFTWQDLGD